MSVQYKTGRRSVLKTLALSGLTFSGVPGLSPVLAQTGKSAKIRHWDVVVIGGGPGGVPAAVAAARNGARVLLVERAAYLGGMATTALVQPYMRYNTKDTLLTRDFSRNS